MSTLPSQHRDEDEEGEGNDEGEDGTSPLLHILHRCGCCDVGEGNGKSKGKGKGKEREGNGKGWVMREGEGNGRWQGCWKNDIVMSSSLFMLITYYSVLTDTNEHD